MTCPLVGVYKDVREDTSARDVISSAITGAGNKCAIRIQVYADMAVWMDFREQIVQSLAVLIVRIIVLIV